MFVNSTVTALQRGMAFVVQSFKRLDDIILEQNNDKSSE